nr:flagellar basal body-associated protein FliL [uncultured Desulfobulbus sp.]
MAENEEKKDDSAEESKKGGKKKLIIIIAAALVLLIGGGGAGYFFLVHKPKQEELKRQQEEASKAEALIEPVPEEAEIGPMIDIKEFVVNIISEDAAHYVKAALSLELDKKDVEEEVKKRMPQIRDSILLLLGNKTFDELQDLQGKNQLKAEIKSKINTFLQTGKVKNVYLTDFVVQ